MVALYLRQEGGIGLKAKIQAYNLQDLGADTLDANLMLGHYGDARDYSLAVKILESLGVGRISLMTNNPDKLKQLIEHGIDVVERLPLIVGVGKENVGSGDEGSENGARHTQGRLGGIVGPWPGLEPGRRDHNPPC